MSTNITDSEAKEEETLPGKSEQIRQEVCEASPSLNGHPLTSSYMPERRLKWNLRSMKPQIQVSISKADPALLSGHPSSSFMPRKRMKRNLWSIPPQNQVSVSKADNLHNKLVKGEVKKDNGLQAAALRSFIHICQPYFNFLETTARTSRLSTDTKHAQKLLEFSQELCDVLENLVQTYASRKLVTLDETDPDNLSHFCIGHIEMAKLRLSVTAFRYCQPMPYLVKDNTGLFKHMRWNVERLDGANGQVTKYYYLCYEDIPNRHADGGKLDSKAVRMWSIGQWVQVKPDPSTENIFDWVLCDVPEGAFEKLLSVGKQEPSSRTANDQMLQLIESLENINFLLDLRISQETSGEYYSGVNYNSFGPGAYAGYQS
ncbi:UPF0575 protein C19orf67 homolog [Syngnathus scovelli]|uniref:UPF0575 protein C19orf67 homolog n=1 Tax=Syngnathus scovelli TaxID=161590 RepID=UPI00210F8E01|nr:UPF0575 protein C19orf67 homolog [Syngnathus scovelli]XP_049577782.1 UPF0575 protein C19orf67 homolog [Syngnathus scovelli]XP_049577784.1 UPF0575 protein C19orf67 homolog [Syngnathus scovelli]